MVRHPRGSTDRMEAAESLSTNATMYVSLAWRGGHLQACVSVMRGKRMCEQRIFVSCVCVCVCVTCQCNLLSYYSLIARVAVYS